MKRISRFSLKGRGVQRRAFDVEAEEEKEDGEEEPRPPEDEEGGEEAPPEEDEEKEELASEDDEEERPEDEGGGDDPAPDEEGGGDEEEPAEEDEKEGRRFIVEGYAATFDSPYLLSRDARLSLFEQVDSRAFDAAEMRDVILQYDHGGRVYARQSNGTLSLSVDRRGLKVRADLSGTEEGRKLWQEIRGGYTTKMSLSFTVDDDETVELSGEGFGSRDERRYLRTIRRVGRVYDVSAVSLPANEGTEIAARSAHDGELSLDRERLAFEIAFSLVQ